MSNLFNELSSAFKIESFSSLIERISFTSTPILINCLEINVEFVSTI